ncbi:MAG: right-handed parallel beta-helix repeat-containing protein [Stigonema ocellatum SAG 48.90 = DSM 106950]|nr:right-handed parallel beta-helix repeat-containing protein [Stigonema ocellatum SAG 48.90 = DSM 106950]
MDPITSNPTNFLVHTSTPVFGDNVQDLLNTGALNVNPTGIIVVNSIADVPGQPGVTTLRDAVNQANADPGEDLIVFDRSLFSSAQTITLNLGELDITHSLDIIAPRDTLTGGDLVTVSGNQASRVFEIGSKATVNLDGLIIANGLVRDDNGGGILNSGILSLYNSIVSNDSATSINSTTGGNGGGIYNSGTISLNNTTISGNSAIGLSNSNGGGISNNGNLTLSNSTINGNSVIGLSISNGGGISNNGNLTLSNSTISGNSAAAPNSSQGGGISNDGNLILSNSTISGNHISAGFKFSTYGAGIYNTSTLEVSNSTISGNSIDVKEAGVGGGIYTSGITTVSNSTISGNAAFDGGGILNVGNTSTLEVSNSTISGNTATRGGGIYNSGNVTLSNSTLSDNNAIGRSITISTLPGSGGGIYNSSTLTVNNSTISGNTASGDSYFSGVSSGGGIYNLYGSTLTLVFSTVTQNVASNAGGLFNSTAYSSSPSGTVNVRNTIIAFNLNSAKGVNPDVSGTFSSNGYNLIGDSTGSTGFDQAIGDIVGTSNNSIYPGLDTLAFNGGSTQTIALLPDSPAIGAANPIVLSTDPTTDQRGLPRRAADGSADIGAFQFS